MKHPLRRTFIFRTRLTPEQCYDRLQASTTPWSLDYFFKRDPKGKPFVGEVSKDGFRLRHIIDYNNSLIPIANGTLKPVAIGTEVVVEFKPHSRAVKFACLLLAVYLGGAILFLTLAILENGFDASMLLVFSTLAVVTTVVSVSVESEFENSKKLLMEVLKSGEHKKKSVIKAMP